MPALTWIEPGAAATPFRDQQIALLTQALADRPGEPAARRRLVGLLNEAGRADEAIAVQLAALESAPADSQGWLDVGRAMMAQGRFDEAQAALACVQAPELRADALARRGAALARLRRFEVAERAFDAALALNPDEPMALRGRGSALIRAGDGAALEAHCREAMRRIGTPAWLVSHLSVALAQQDRTDDLRALLDYERLIYVVDIEPPEGHGSLQAFNAALATFVAAHARFEVIDRAWDSPVRSALLARGGWSPGPDADAATSPLAALKRVFKREAQRYRDRGDIAPEHPHATGRPAAVELHMSFHLLRTGGHIDAHVHPMAWINAVYYVEMPAAVTHSATGAGWLHFGAPAYDDARLPARWPLTRVQPKAGRLVMFPSFLSHWVAPVEVDENRTTIAFEVLPVRQTNPETADQE